MIFKVFFYHIWAWQSSWSCDLDHLKNFRSPILVIAWTKTDGWFLKFFFTIYGHDSHLGHVTWTIWKTFVPPSLWNSTWNFASFGSVVSEEKMFENVTYTISSPMSLPLRRAKMHPPPPPQKKCKLCHNPIKIFTELYKSNRYDHNEYTKYQGPSSKSFSKIYRIYPNVNKEIYIISPIIMPNIKALACMVQVTGDMYAHTRTIGQAKTNMSHQLFFEVGVIIKETC